MPPTIHLIRHAHSSLVHDGGWMRARDAADWLSTQAAHDARVVSITQGGFRRIIHAQLVQRGWRAERTSRGHHNWSCWSYTR